jgi:hypothetical protein
MAKSIKLEVQDAQILVSLWSLPTEGAARWIRGIKESSGRNREALFIPISSRRFDGIASLVPKVSDELQAPEGKPDGA